MNRKFSSPFLSKTPTSNTEITPLRSNTVFTPTSGSISKTLLTPCRRLGLTRKKRSLSLNPENQLSPVTTNVSSPIPNKTTKKSSIQQCQLHTSKQNIENSSPLTSYNKNSNVISKEKNISSPSTNSNVKVKTYSSSSSNNSISNTPEISKRKIEVSSPLTNNTPEVKRRPIDISKRKLVLSLQKLDTTDLSTKKEYKEHNISNKKLPHTNEFNKKTKSDITIKNINTDDCIRSNNRAKSMIVEIKAHDTQKDDFTNLSSVDLQRELEEIRKRLKEKEAKLVNLKRIDIYKRKHNLEELTQVTNKWKRCCQDALQQLVVLVKQEKGIDCTVEMLLRDLNIPSQLVGYNKEEDCFSI